MRIALLVSLLASAAAFHAGYRAPGPLQRVATRSAASPMMGWMDDAFANDKSLGKAKSAGLSKEATKRTVTWVGPKGQKKQGIAVPGQQMRDVARACGIPIKYDCREGTCKTCLSSMGKICVARMPNKDVTIKYNIKG